MNFEGFTTSQSSTDIKKRYNKKKENYLKIFITSFKQIDKKTGKMLVKRLTKMANDIKNIITIILKAMITLILFLK